jgi:hypothetical protein
MPIPKLLPIGDAAPQSFTNNLQASHGPGDALSIAPGLVEGRILLQVSKIRLEQPETAVQVTAVGQ